MCGFMVKLRHLAPMPAQPYLGAMAETPIISELYKAKAIVEADLDAAVEAYMADPKTSQFLFAGGYSLDLMVAVRAQASARKLMKDPKSRPSLKRAVVRRAILLARPVKG